VRPKSYSLPSSSRTSLAMPNIKSGKMKIAKLLVQAGADLESEDIVKNTPLLLATENGYHEIAQYYIEQGANIHHVDTQENTAAFLAASRGNEEVVRLLCHTDAINYQTKTNGTSVLQEAISRNHHDTALAILECGADVNTADNFKNTPLHAAVSRKEAAEVVTALISKGANVNAKGLHGTTPLMKAVNLEMAKLLVEAGADIDLTDNSGRSVIEHLSDYSTRDEIIEYLRNL